MTGRAAMPPPITNSPFLTLPLLDRLLSPTSESSPSPEDRVQLLSAKIYLLANRQSTSGLEPSGRSTRSCAPVISTATTEALKGGSGSASANLTSGEHANAIASAWSGPSGQSERQIVSSNERGEPQARQDINKPDRSRRSDWEKEQETIRQELELLATRLELSRAYMALKIPDLRGAEGELGLVEGGCKGLMKRLDRSRSGKGTGESHKSHRQSMDGNSPVGTINSAEIEHPGADELDNDIAAKEAMRLDVLRLRIEGLKAMVEVDEGLGRAARAERTRGVIRVLENG